MVQDQVERHLGSEVQLLQASFLNRGGIDVHVRSARQVSRELIIGTAAQDP
jgi:hypothetical protein